MLKENKKVLSIPAVIAADSKSTGMPSQRSLFQLVLLRRSQAHGKCCLYGSLILSSWNLLRWISTYFWEQQQPHQHYTEHSTVHLPYTSDVNTSTHSKNYFTYAQRWLHTPSINISIRLQWSMFCYIANCSCIQPLKETKKGIIQVIAILQQKNLQQQLTNVYIH